MIILFVSFLILLFLLFIYISSFKYRDDVLDSIDKKKHALYFLYPMVAYFLLKTGLDKKFLNKADISRKIRALHISDHHEAQISLYWYQKTSLILLIIFAFSSISLTTSLQSVFIKPSPLVAYLVRPEEGEGDSQVTLRFHMEKESDKEDVYEDEIVIQNKKRIYTDKEWSKVVDKAIIYLEGELMGENQGLDYVYSDLNFVKNIPNTGLSVEWRPRDNHLISSSGEIKNDDLAKDIETLVTAILKYRDRSVEHTIPLRIWPIELDKRERLYKELQSEISIADEESVMNKEWSLPRKSGDYNLTWITPEDNPALTILILGLFGSALIWFYRDRELENRMNIRKSQMLIDYPEIINKFNLLVNAGMTIKQAWSKISVDYRQKTEKDKGYNRYAYEEMLLTMHELKLGIPEASAYEQYGRRVGLFPYMRFSSMLVQNLKKGNKNMVYLLRQEAEEAFQERKETAKRLGEEASTKLLGPMLIMLLIVLTIIVIPAFMSFNI